MKRIGYLLILIFAAIQVNAEDIIVFRNGSVAKGKVIEVGVSEIKYKKSSNPKGPSYAIPKTDVLSINYDNGEIESFDNVVSKQSEEPNIATSGDNNQSLCYQYNQAYPTRQDFQKPSGETNYAYIYWGIGDESILISKDIEINFEMNKSAGYEVGFMTELYPYQIAITNRTGKPVYIDLGNTYRVFDDGVNKTSEVWYDGKSYIENREKSNNSGLALGAVTGVLGIGGVLGNLANGISVGHNSGSSLSVDKSGQRIIGIGPYGRITLPAHLSAVDTSVKESYELMEVESTKKIKNQIGLSIKKWELKKYKETDLPWKYDFYITVSNDSEFRSYQMYPIHLYARALYGVGKLEKLTSVDFSGDVHFNSLYDIDDNTKFVFSRIRFK